LVKKCPLKSTKTVSTCSQITEKRRSIELKQKLQENSN